MLMHPFLYLCDFNYQKWYIKNSNYGFQRFNIL